MNSPSTVCCAFQIPTVFGTHGDGLAYCKASNQLYLALQQNGKTVLYLFDTVAYTFTNVGTLMHSTWGASCKGSPGSPAYWYATARGQLRKVLFNATTGMIASDTVYAMLPLDSFRAGGKVPYTLGLGDIAFDPNNDYTLYISATGIGHDGAYHTR